MAIVPETQYAGKITPATTAYPLGSARNITVPGDGTGTPWEQALVNDLFGFQQTLLARAAITASGFPDSVTAPQYYQALQTLGVMDYDAGRTYPAGAFVKTATAVYQGLTAGNVGNNPDSDGGTNWGPLATLAALATKADKPGETAITGTATFTNATNNLALPGIGSIGLEIGDVVQVTGTANNNKLFTVEVITDSGNIIFNRAHAGGTTSKSFFDETVSATITLVSKWFNAPTGLGQGLVDVVTLRSKGVVYSYTSNRSFIAYISTQESFGNRGRLLVDGLLAQETGNAQTEIVGFNFEQFVPAGSSYKFTNGSTIIGGRS